MFIFFLNRKTILIYNKMILVLELHVTDHGYDYTVE